MAVVPLPHPDSTVPGRSDPYWLIPGVGARSGPSDSNVRCSNDQHDPDLMPASLSVAQFCAGGGGHKQVTKRATHARPGLQLQQCSAVPLTILMNRHFCRLYAGAITCHRPASLTRRVCTETTGRRSSVRGSVHASCLRLIQACF